MKLSQANEYVKEIVEADSMDMLHGGGRDPGVSCISGL